MGGLLLVAARLSFAERRRPYDEYGLLTSLCPDRGPVTRANYAVDGSRLAMRVGISAAMLRSRSATGCGLRWSRRRHGARRPRRWNDGLVMGSVTRQRSGH